MTLALRILRDDAWKLAAFFVILLVNAIATVLAYPAFEENYEALLAFVPSFMAKLSSALLDAGSTGILAFASINHLFKAANVLGAAAAILLAMGSFSRETELGTIGVLLSRPLSRRRILTTFVVVHSLELIVPLLLVTVLIPSYVQFAIDETIPTGPLLLGAIHAAAFLLLVYAIAMVAATALSEQIKVAGIAGGLLITSFILYFIDATRPYTLYRLSSLDHYTAIARGEPFDLPMVAGMLAAALVLFAIADRILAKRDF
jgi:ABC-type transport system involved in multi-copper enzyme maturation permease subunit